MIEIWMLLAAVFLDLALGEPPAALHPVVWIGRLISMLQRHWVASPRLQIVQGAGIVVATLTVFVVPTIAILALLHELCIVAYFVVGTFLLKCTFSIRELLSAAFRVRDALVAGDLEQARMQLRSLVSRDTSSLPMPLIVAATVESLAENAGDSFVAPMFFYVLFGIPGALAYRVVNTCDSMIGYRGQYEYLGKAAARLDDLLNWIPSRLTALLMVLASAPAGLRVGAAWRTMGRDCGLTESPNAGWPMSAAAGALSVTLEKVGHYRLGNGTGELSPATISLAGNLVMWTLGFSVAAFLAALVVRDGYFS